MGVHESSVNFRNLIRDLADMYPQDVSEVVLVELIANSLDAHAERIEISFNPAHQVLVVKDDGSGMSESQFDQYHDFAAGLKTRGQGIGFAGVGAKVSFNIAERVVTETRGEKFCGGSNWYFRSRRRLVWEDVEVSRLESHGTRVEVRFARDATLRYSSTEDLIQVIRRSYLPLLIEEFLAVYEDLGTYSRNIRFVVNNQVVMPHKLMASFQLDRVKEFIPRRRGKRFGYGVFGVGQSEYPIDSDVSGVLLCTMGKVIKAELFSQFPAEIGPRIFGLVEAPEFVKYLTTSKTDFTRSKHRQLEQLYGPIRQEFKEWLNELGVQQTAESSIDEAAKLERELKMIVEEVPELDEFFGFRSRKNVLTATSGGLITASPYDGADNTFPVGGGLAGSGAGVTAPGEEEGTALTEDTETGTVRAAPISRTAKRGPRVTFVDAPEHLHLAWVEGNTVVVNKAHPCYKKTEGKTGVRKLNCVYAIAVAIQRFLGEAVEKPDLCFVDRMMAAWGRK